jgi:hypothetical protein
VDAVNWGLLHNITVVYSRLSQKIVTQTHMETPFQMEMSITKTKSTLPKNREMEYFSYILHLFDEIQCVYNVCTQPSNFCRVIDSFRSTVGGKSNQYNVDISAETCPSPPCFRQFSLGNYNGSVFTPTGIIWRK